MPWRVPAIAVLEIKYLALHRPSIRKAARAFTLACCTEAVICAGMLPLTPSCLLSWQVRLAIAHALAQSSKLSVFEERVWDLVEETRWVELPV
jgi:uncharacterized Rmd1/YagE family protein